MRLLLDDVAVRGGVRRAALAVVVVGAPVVVLVVVGLVRVRVVVGCALLGVRPARRRVGVALVVHPARHLQSLLSSFPPKCVLASTRQGKGAAEGSTGGSFFFFGLCRDGLGTFLSESEIELWWKRQQAQFPRVYKPEDTPFGAVGRQLELNATLCGQGRTLKVRGSRWGRDDMQGKIPCYVVELDGGDLDQIEFELVHNDEAAIYGLAGQNEAIDVERQVQGKVPDRKGEDRHESGDDDEAAAARLGGGGARGDGAEGEDDAAPAGGDGDDAAAHLGGDVDDLVVRLGGDRDDDAVRGIPPRSHGRVAEKFGEGQ
eukprot:CAMPEP_0118895652 /NCGR_PEP_ID=MMETSP1166-20130328/3906_1 /TAXON_ID=1104430 /ORGANISM="Chrysoreinhardia sp, Strain CCMP3193" /LENGTH=315 /DNA_ID=CAMNT_0006834697 /DNA_START=212 /DNA_END=1160 /DNA_ORIENTATION=+